jgi:hypothetical protein
MALERGRLCLAQTPEAVAEAEGISLRAREQARSCDRIALLILADTELAQLAPRTGRIRAADGDLAADLSKWCSPMLQVQRSVAVPMRQEPSRAS